MGHSENNEMEFLQINIDIDFQQIEKNLEQRRRVKLSLLTIIFLLSLAAIIYSVIHDLRTKGEFRHISKSLFSGHFFYLIVIPGNCAVINYK